MDVSGSLQHIDAVDAFARTLFLRIQHHASPEFSDVALAVRQLHLGLRHLRIEAADQDSLLNRGPDSVLYARQVQPIIQDCDFALKQLETILARCDAAGSQHVPADRVAAVKSRLDKEKIRVEMLLDTVQLHSPANQQASYPALRANDASLNHIKDKVDSIAERLFSRRYVGGSLHDEQRLWQEFKSELEKEGFSSHVLRQHKEVLRAYIRELESGSSLNGGAPPTVRGLLEKQAHPTKPPPVPPKDAISGKSELLYPGPVPSAPWSHEGLSASSAAAMPVPTEPMAVISTKDLAAIDSLQSDMAGVHLHPHGQQQYASSPRNSPRYLTSGAAESSSPHGTSPHTYACGQPSGPMPLRLAPDRNGKEIPMDAQWTKIRRALVSPEVLEQAGVRYEARPDYVAVLGRLSREQIATYARQSAECRAARAGGFVPRSKSNRRPRADSRYCHDDDDEYVDDDDKESVLWDESDTTDYDDNPASEKGSKHYPYIVSLPRKGKTSSSGTAMPKSILKNKNENQVRFDPEPYEVEPHRPLSFTDDGDRDRRSVGGEDHGGRRRHDHRRREDYDYRYREEQGRSHDGYRRDRHGYDRYGGDRHRRGYEGDHRRVERRDARAIKKAWGETLGAVGIGGAAASLLGVLAEAAVGM